MISLLSSALANAIIDEITMSPKMASATANFRLEVRLSIDFLYSTSFIASLTIGILPALILDSSLNTATLSALIMLH